MDFQSLQLISNNDPVSITKPANNEKLPAEDSFWGSDGFTFGDLVDIFNPMQHIPVISKYYREQTLDGASEGSKLVGGVVFGGLIGGISGVLTSIANSAVRHETRQDISEHILGVANKSMTGIAFPQENKAAGNENKKIQLSNKEYVRVSGYDFKNSRLTNTFFAQTLEEHSNDYFFSLGKENVPDSQRSRNWGKV